MRIRTHHVRKILNLILKEEISMSRGAEMFNEIVQEEDNERQRICNN